MLIAPTTTPSATPATATAMSPPAAPPPPVTTTPDTPADSVSLSPEAQQALAAASEPPSADDLNRAVAALNDTSGKASIEDQLQAYKLVADLAAKGDTGPAGVALLDSPFARRAQSLLTAIAGLKDWSGGTKTADSFDNALAAFDSLSASDQQIYVGAIGLQNQMISGETPNASVYAYRANQQARAAVERALAAAETNPTYASLIATNPYGGANDFYGRRDALVAVAGAAGDDATVALAKLSHTPPDTDDWTAKVQAHFAQYGPAPAAEAPSPAPTSLSLSAPSGPSGKTLMAALATLNDTSGKAAVADQLAAYDMVNGYLRATDNVGPARAAIAKAFSAATFAQHVWGLDDAVSGGLGPGTDAPKVQLDRLNRLSDDDQQAYFALNSHDDAGKVRFASLDSMKHNYSARSAINTLYAGILARYGVDDASKINDPAFTGSPLFKTLQSLRWTNDQGYDSWTGQARKLLDSLDDEAPAKAKAAQTPEEAASARVLETLKHVADSQKRFLEGVRSRGTEDAPVRNVLATSRRIDTHA